MLTVRILILALFVLYFPEENDMKTFESNAQRFETVFFFDLYTFPIAKKSFQVRILIQGFPQMLFCPQSISRGDLVCSAAGNAVSTRCIDASFLVCIPQERGEVFSHGEHVDFLHHGIEKVERHLL